LDDGSALSPPAASCLAAASVQGGDGVLAHGLLILASSSDTCLNDLAHADLGYSSGTISSSNSALDAVCPE